jgi:chromosome partitioning protein
MQTVAFLNRKGGVSKTSSCMHLSWSLAKRGQRVLLVDLDSQANLTEGMLGLDSAALPARQTVAALFDEAGPPPTCELIVPTPFAGVSIMPGHGDTEDAYVKRPWETGPLQYALRDALTDVAPSYDIVLCDCPPNVLLTSWAALVAASGVVVPLLAEEFAAGGVAKIQEPIRRVQSGANPGLKLLGYLLTLYNKSLMVHVDYEADLRQAFGADVFAAVVPLATVFKEAVGVRKPIGVYKPRSAGAKAIDGLAGELLDRLAQRTSTKEFVAGTNSLVPDERAA